MSDYKIPELPSDEELGIAGMSLDDDEDAAAPAPPPPSSPPASKGPGKPPRAAKPTASDAGPRRAWRGPATLALLVLLAWATSSQRFLPSPRPANAPDTVFSSARAMVELVRIAERPHPPGSPEHTRVQGYLIGRLRDLGLEPEMEPTTSLIRDGSTVRGATVRNVVARLPGSSSTGAVLLTAHYDSRGISPGAGDDASGVAAILETLRALRAGPPLRNDLIVLFTDAEELGLLGARAFTAEHRWMGDVTVVLSVEMRGGGGPSIMFETGAENGWIVEALRASGARPYANSLSYEVYRRLPNDTDFTPFVEQGKQGLNFAGIGRAHVYHQAYDTPARFQEATLQHHGENLLGVARALGDGELGSVRDPDLVFFAVPLLGVVAYPPSLGWALAGALAVLALVVLLVVRRAGGRWGGVLVGLLLGILSTAATAGAAWAIFVQVRPRHPEYGHLQGSVFHAEGWYVLAVTALALLVVSGSLALARRRFSLGALSLGAMLPPVLAACFAAVRFPMGAMNLEWPALAGLLAALVVAGLGPLRRAGTAAWTVLLLLAVPVLVFLVPVTELVWAAMSFALAPVLGVLVVFALLLLLPWLDALREPNGWWAPLLALLAAGGFLGAGLLAARPSAERPAPSTLVYLLDRETGRSLWATRPGPGLEWANAQVGRFGEERPLDEFQLGGVPYRLAEAPPFQVPRLLVAELDGEVGAAAGATPPTGDARATGGARDAAVAEPFVEPPLTDTGGAAPDSTASPPAPPLGLDAPPGRARVRLRMRSAVGAERIDVRLPEGAGARIVAVNGRALGEVGSVIPGPGVRTLVHWGEPVGALTVDLEIDARGEPLEVEVVEHLLRPQEVTGSEPFQRPPELAPDVPAASDRALIRNVLRVSPAGVTIVGARAPETP